MNKSLTDLINHVGLKNVQVQFLSTALKGVRTNKKGESVVSFYTNAMTANDVMNPTDDTKVGIVIWVPSKKLEEFRTL